MLEQPFRRNFLQHSLAVSAWMRRCGAQGGIDPRTLGMEISLGERAVRLYPQFTIERSGEIVFVRRMQPGVSGFVGWMPYPGKSWKEATDKWEFKAFARAHGLRTPLYGEAATVPATDYVIKDPGGSLGKGLRGPYAASSRVEIPPNHYWEQFVRGRVVKAWYWSGQLEVVEIVPMPTVTGDGVQSVAELALRALGAVVAEHRPPVELLELQGVSLASVPQSGATVQLEYRYVSPLAPANQEDHDVRSTLRGTALEKQLAEAGRICAAAVAPESRENTAFTLDAVLDAKGCLWFLEMNCNPQIHPALYAPVLDCLLLPARQEV